MRAVLVVTLIILPSAILPGGADDNTQIVALVAIFAALFTIVEYSANSPSLVEFRDAPPFNRVRFFALFATVICLSLIFRGFTSPSKITESVQNLGHHIGRVIDFPMSPVRLMADLMPAATSPELVNQLRDAAGLSYLISLVSVIWFVIMLRLQQWPRRGGSFNVWVNLPTFDPTAGGDVVKRLKRDRLFNIILGFLLPFLIPAIIKLASFLGGPVRLDDPHVLIWTVTAWAFLPASILMRGVALGRVAQMIDLQRQKAQSTTASN
ncbi:hypothetical protein [Yoonia sp.]|uniref:hypothetical protein n=1 Tax=Yoonia sp. TaxID=2212373 RepID=UPI0019D9944B|nr:hypothetical protein [Yoonia sp.]MBE0412114.1 hypothetical protein [Yoonia sp.]